LTQKQRFIVTLQGILQENLAEAQQALSTTQASLGNETKSTAGDKYETGRAMVQIELQKMADQRDKIDLQLQTLARVDAHLICSTVEFGSFIETAHEQYFVAIGLGKVTFEGRTCYAISLDSPIGKALKGKKVGDTIPFQGRMLEIRAIS
jgi:transcription elongation GreA/GreB family factor